jgi:hypothetical protein
MPYAGYLPESAVPGRQPMTDTHPFDPALFRDAAIECSCCCLIKSEYEGNNGSVIGCARFQ